MKKQLNSALGTGLLIFMAACQTAQTPPTAPVATSATPTTTVAVPAAPVAPQTAAQVQEAKSNIPDWCLVLPTEVDHLYACGVAKSDNLNFARRRAVLDAKRQLAGTINGRISSVMNDFVTSTGSGTNETILQHSVVITRNLIEETGLWGYEQIGSDTQTDGNKFRHYVLMRFPIGRAQMRLLAKIRDDDTLYGQTKAKQKLAELEERTLSKKD